MLFYLYILYSEKFDKYYVGYTDDIDRRLEEHNKKSEHTFTSKYRPWKLAKYFEIGLSRGLAMKIEKHVKNQKSRKYLERLIELDNIEILISRFESDFG